jgi:hypothetical protein
MSHDAFGIEFERLSKAFDALRLVEGKAPVQTQVEPALRFRRGCRNNPGMAAKVETIHLSNSSIARTGNAAAQARETSIAPSAF